MSKLLPTPDDLGVAGRDFWDALHSDFDGFNPADLAMIGEIARSLDLLDDLRRTIAETGVLTSGSKGQPVAHPALAAIVTLQRSVAFLIRQLGLEEDEAPDASPSVRPATSAKARRAAQTRWRTG